MHTAHLRVFCFVLACARMLSNCYFVILLFHAQSTYDMPDIMGFGPASESPPQIDPLHPTHVPSRRAEIRDRVGIFIDEHEGTVASLGGPLRLLQVRTITNTCIELFFVKCPYVYTAVHIKGNLLLSTFWLTMHFLNHLVISCPKGPSAIPCRSLSDDSGLDKILGLLRMCMCTAAGLGLLCPHRPREPVPRHGSESSAREPTETVRAR